MYWEKLLPLGMIHEVKSMFGLQFKYNVETHIVTITPGGMHGLAKPPFYSHNRKTYV